MDKKPYRVAELAYRPWHDHPWYVVRTGAVVNQGGLGFGTEGVAFAELNDAIEYIRVFTKRDLQEIEDAIKEDSKWKDV